MRVSWTPPDFNGGSPILGYRLEVQEMASNEWTPVDTNKSTYPSILVKDLHEKTQYQFRVSAENQIGTGSYSLPSDSFKTLGIFLFNFH